MDFYLTSAATGATQLKDYANIGDRQTGWETSQRNVTVVDATATLAPGRGPPVSGRQLMSNCRGLEHPAVRAIGAAGPALNLVSTHVTNVVCSAFVRGGLFVRAELHIHTDMFIAHMRTKY